MESLNQSFGFVIYSTKLPTALQGKANANLTISGLHDRASVYIDGALKGIGMRSDPKVSKYIIVISYNNYEKLT